MKNWRRFLPYLDFRFDIGWVQIYTTIYCVRPENPWMTDWVMLHVGLFWKWKFSVRLYSIAR